MFAMILFAVYAARGSNSLSTNRLTVKKSFFRAEILFPLFLFAIIFGMRYDVGVDHLNYLEGYLYTNKKIDFPLEKDVSYNRCEHLLGRIDTNPEQHFHTYKENSRRLSNQPIREMSNLTQRLLVSIDFESIARKRRFNFNYIHNDLGKRNKLKLEISSADVPMVYLFLVDNGKLLKNQLISNKIYVASYWPNVIKWANSKSFEYDLAENLLAVPIDQRYSKNELDEIIKILKW